jgi:2-polyprenyl-3-methyl-5-hydroxy-6-metoxy-1,4-benzoquinol methylase
MRHPATPSDEIIRSWDANAEEWTRLVRGGRLESRRIATDEAILIAVSIGAPKKVLDVGCGGGWLCRALEKRGIPCVGVDGSATLVEAARVAGAGEYHHISYEELAAHPDQLGRASFDSIVCNFSLLAEELEPLLRVFVGLLAADGRLVIQTVHPWSVRGEDPYTPGWRLEQFDSFDGEFEVPMPWYFRTLSSWVQELRLAGFGIEQLLEPLHPQTGEPLSLVIVAHPSVV